MKHWLLYSAVYYVRKLLITLFQLVTCKEVLNISHGLIIYIVIWFGTSEFNLLGECLGFYVEVCT